MEQGLTMHDMDDLTWHSYGCYSQTLQRLRKLSGLHAVHNIRKYAEVVGYELTLKKIKEKREDNV